MKPVWGGRFGEPMDPRVLAFTSSFGVDWRLLPQDIRGSIAHARMLGAVGLVTPDEAARLTAALEEILVESAGLSPKPDEAEDVHSWVEGRLREKLGDLAGKLHTARSRNDQVALDLRLWLGDAGAEVLASLRSLRGVLLRRAGEHLETLMPGYTHFQPAQPVLLAHHLMAYEEMFRRDTGRFRDALARGLESPLGAGALAGTTLPIDRDMTARELGFPGPTRNSMDTVSDRDFPLEFMAAAAVAMAHLSRLAEELVLWSSPAFGFVRLPDRLATGSSMMPQKKNPDVAELIRGRCGRVVGDLVSLLTSVKGLPLTYQRDLQEDKEPLFDAADTLLACLEAAALYLDGAEFDRELMAAEAGRGHAVATDLAEYLVARGVPFRGAHEAVGKAVREAVERGLDVADLTPADLRRHSPLFDDDVAPLLSAAGSVGAKRSFGSTSPGLVADALGRARAALASEGAAG